MRGLLVAAAGLCLAAGPVAAEPAKTMLSVREVMRHVLNPAAETFWKGSGSVSTEEGVAERAPTSDESWGQLVDAAAVVLETGNLLQMDGRARSDEAWARFARQLTEAGAAGMGAAKARDADKVFETGGDIYNACFACHAKYIPRPKNSLWKQP